ncbi:unnamed protein product [Clonostachys rosea]|uniref:Uncharacterized protein n=1 Tax=Bionectria ochroleuca TaxID=29856 RepID=A0ABY6UGV5_BIOOC|nr:unnamed protein product [Clonostachys rosea]
MATVSNGIVSGALINSYKLFLYCWDHSLDAFYMLLILFVTILLWLYPHLIQIVTMACSTISILGLYGCSMLGGKTLLWPVMASAQLLVLPLLWIWIVHHTTSWKGFITYLTLSLAGWGGSKLINETIGELGKKQVMIFAVLQPCLLGCLWVLEVIRDWRVVRAAQQRLVRSEYQDNATEAAWEINEDVVHNDVSQGFKELKAKKWSVICWFSLLLVPEVLMVLFMPTSLRGR